MPQEFKNYLKAITQAFSFVVEDLKTHGHHPSSYRLVKQPDEKDLRVYFQIISKNIILKMLPEEIMRDDMLMGFSKADIAIITHLGTKSEEAKKATVGKKPNVLSRIVQQLFHSGKSKFLVKHQDKDTVSQHAPEELFYDPDTKDRFSTADGLAIGYAAAEERYQRLMAETQQKPAYELLALMNDVLEYRDMNSNETIKQSAEFIFNDSTLFEGFRSQDRCQIAYAAAECRYQRLMQETKSHVTLRLCSTLINNSNIFSYENVKTGEQSEGLVDVLFYNTDLLEQFSTEDRSVIAFAAGEFMAARKHQLCQASL